MHQYHLLNNIFEYGSDSVIIKTMLNKQSLLELLNINDISKIRLIFRQVKDAWGVEFEEACKGKTNLVICMKLKGDTIIGGYLDISMTFNRECIAEASDNAYLFTLTRGSKHPIKYREVAYLG